MGNQVVFQKITNSKIQVITSTGEYKEFTVTDDCPYNDQLLHLRRYDILFIDSESFEQESISRTSIFVIEPHYMVPVTGILDAISCPRKTYVKLQGAEEPLEKETLQRMTEGNLLHSVFTQRLVQGTSVEKAVKNSLQEFKVDLLTYDISEKTAELYLQRNSTALNSIMSGGLSEIDCEHPEYGIHGKIDGIMGKNTLIELKTSKIPDTHPWPNHNIQMSIYQWITPEEYTNARVLYINDGQMAIKANTDWNHVQTVVARNYAYFVLSGRYIPPILRGEQMRECSKCYVREGCQKLCAGLETQRDCLECTHNENCSKIPWAELDRDYYQHFSRDLIKEENAQITDSTFSHKKLKDKQFVQESIEQGTILFINRVLETRELTNGFEIDLVYESKTPGFRQGDYLRIFPDELQQKSQYIFFSGVLLNIEPTTLTIQSPNRFEGKAIILGSTSISLLRRSRRAIYQTINTKDTLNNIITKSLNSSFVLQDIVYQQEDLKGKLKTYNTNQALAINSAISTPDIFVIQGPAGTGKTSVVTEIINQLQRKQESVLVCTYTNMALDNIGKQLLQANIPFMRLGRKISTSPELHDSLPNVKQEDYQLLFENSKGRVVLTTTSTISNNQYDVLWFDTLIIDEAAQMTEPEALKAISRAGRLIMVGDHQQLPPIILSKTKFLQKSLFERLREAFPNRFLLLNEQYRMNNEILQFVNHKYYQGKLKAANNQIATQNLGVTGLLPYQVINIKTYKKHDSYNWQEAVLVNVLVEYLKEHGLKNEQIGIITPYRRQVGILRTLVPNITVDTIDRFQGSEKLVIIFSTVTNQETKILTDPRRWNVALTRARAELIILSTGFQETNAASIAKDLYQDAVDRQVIWEIKADSNETFIQKIEDKLHFSFPPNLKENLHEKLTDKEISSNITQIEINGVIQSVHSISGSCALCMQDLKTGIQCLRCDSKFHPNHLQGWLDVQEYCPICKISMKNIN